MLWYIRGEAAAYLEEDVGDEVGEKHREQDGQDGGGEICLLRGIRVDVQVRHEKGNHARRQHHHHLYIQVACPYREKGTPVGVVDKARGPALGSWEDRPPAAYLTGLNQIQISSL
eukprot:9492292-Pyramimonas_sp.AAC.1